MDKKRQAQKERVLQDQIQLFLQQVILEVDADAEQNKSGHFMAEQFIDVKKCESCPILMERGALPQTKSTGLSSDQDYLEEREERTNSDYEMENELDQSYKVYKLFDDFVKELMVEVPDIVQSCIKANHKSQAVARASGFNDYNSYMRNSYQVDIDKGNQKAMRTSANLDESLLSSN